MRSWGAEATAGWAQTMHYREAMGGSCQWTRSILFGFAGGVLTLLHVTPLFAQSSKALCYFEFAQAAAAAAQTGNEAWELVGQFIDSGGMGVPSQAKALYDEADKLRESARATLDACLRSVKDTETMEHAQYDAVARATQQLQSRVKVPALVKRIIGSAFDAISAQHRSVLNSLDQTLKEMQQINIPKTTAATSLPQASAPTSAKPQGGDSISTSETSSRDNALVKNLLAHVWLLPLPDRGDDKIFQFRSDGHARIVYTGTTSCGPADCWHNAWRVSSAHHIEFTEVWLSEVCEGDPNGDRFDITCYRNCADRDWDCEKLDTEVTKWRRAEKYDKSLPLAALKQH